MTKLHISVLIRMNVLRTTLVRAMLNVSILLELSNALAQMDTNWNTLEEAVKISMSVQKGVTLYARQIEFMPTFLFFSFICNKMQPIYYYKVLQQGRRQEFQSKGSLLFENQILSSTLKLPQHSFWKSTGSQEPKDPVLTQPLEYQMRKTAFTK